MKKIILYIYVCATGLLLSGCNDYCCDCDNNNMAQSGNFRIIRDWGGLANMEKPDGLDVYFYHPALAPRHETVYTDTTYFDLPAGNYHILATSTTGAATYTGLDNYFTAQIVLPVEVKDSNAITVEAPASLLAGVTTTINERQNECTIIPVSLNKIINFTFNIHSPLRMSDCRAALGGVQTSVMLYTSQPVYAAALLPFVAKEIKENTFYKSLSTLGLAKGNANLLTIQLTDSNGINKETVLDLTDTISFETSHIQNCIIEITMNADTIQSSVTVKDFEPGTDGEINIH